MLDHSVRRAIDPVMKAAAKALDRGWISPDRLSVAGLVIGLASAGSAAMQWWGLALILWLLNRLVDGLDGPLARRRKAVGPGVGGRGHNSEAGGFLDISADFVVYGAAVVGVGYGVVAGYDSSWLPFVLVLFAYYINGAVFLAFSSIAERTGRTMEDGRSLSFLGGLAEGTETVIAHSLWLIFPAYAAGIAWVWAAVVAISATQRIVAGYRSLL